MEYEIRELRESSLPTILMVVEHGIPIPLLYIHVCYIVPSCPLIGKSDVGSLRYYVVDRFLHGTLCFPPHARVLEAKKVPILCSVSI